MAESKYYGLYQGIVTNIKDPEKRGRIKVRCPEILGAETESAWCDPLVQVAYDNGGDFCIPSVEEAVWLQFIAGDVNKPVWLGGWWREKKTPIGDNYEKIDQIRIISYADCTITMQNDKIDINIKSGNFDLRIEDGKLTVNGNLTVNGTVTAKSISTSGNAGAITTTTVNASNVITAKAITVTDNITANSLDVGSVSADSVSATSVSANSVTANGVSLADHTHGGVTSGLSDTKKPNN